MILVQLAEELGLNPKYVASTGGGEYHSACPACGGKDRFIVQPNKARTNCSGSYWCRQCNESGDTIEFCRRFFLLDFYSAVDRANGSLVRYQPLQKILQLSCSKIDTSYHQALVAPSSPWTTKALLFVEKAHHDLLQDAEILGQLNERGLPLDAVQRYKLGITYHDVWPRGEEWGLDRDSVWVSKGIVIPTMHKDDVVRIKVRRTDYKVDDEWPKYVEISGSMNGLNIIGNPRMNTMIVVESELDAYALHHVLHDVAVIVAVGSNTKNPDNVTDNLAKQKQHLLICHDNDEHGPEMLHKWKKLYAHARAYPTPFAKDVGDAIKEKLDVRPWIMKEIGVIDTGSPKEAVSPASQLAPAIKHEEEAIQQIFMFAKARFKDPTLG